ncbi:hypothetical protein P3T33_000626 [Rhizobium sp. AN67]|nr:hypothetical protein [Rhizobium sp. AN67]SOD60276.1 hypothetical protein SAMN05216595_5169 [Rhizobium sp. AN6A]
MTQPITIERVERALDKLAEIIVLLGENGINVLPIYDRLEKELAALRSSGSQMDEVRARAARSKLRQHKDRSR